MTLTMEAMLWKLDRNIPCRPLRRSKAGAGVRVMEMGLTGERVTVVGETGEGVGVGSGLGATLVCVSGALVGIGSCTG